MVKGGKSKEMKRKNQQVTSSNMVLKSLLRPARYFDGLMTNPSCYTRTKAPRRPCLICASFQHVTKHCSMSHRDKDCSDKTSSVCLRCGGLGHDMGLCKYEYTEDDLKSVQCYVCKSFGHLCCVEPCDSPPSLWAVSCYRCGQLCHTGLSCGRHYEGSPETESGFGRVKEAEKNKRRNVKAIATSEAIRKKKKQRLDEEGVAVFIDDSNEKRERETTTLSSLKKIDVTSEEKSIPHESNWTMTEKKRTKKKRKKINKNLEQHSSFHESIGKTKKNHVEPEQNFTAHESNRKRKKNKKAKGEQPPITEKPNLRSGWITEDLEEDSFHRVKVRRLSSPTTRSGHDHYILPVSPPGHNHRLHTTHFGHNYESPSLTSGGHYPGSSSTAPYDRNRINSSFESDGHLSGPPPSRLWQRNYHPTSPIAPLGHGHHRLPVTPPAHNHRSPTFSYGGHYAGSLSLVPCGDNPRYSSLESDRHVLDLPFSRLRQRYYSPTSPVAASGHCRRRLPVTPPGHNHRLPAFSSGEHHTGSLSSVPPHGGNHRDSSFEYNWHHLDSQFLRRQPYYHPTSPITPPSHNHHMLTGTYLNGNHLLPSTYKDGNHRSPTFNSGGHYSTPLSSTRYAGNHINLRFESDGHLSGPSISRWNPYYTPTSSHDQQQHHIYGHAPSRYGPAHHYDGGSIN